MVLITYVTDNSNFLIPLHLRSALIGEKYVGSDYPASENSIFNAVRLVTKYTLRGKTAGRVRGESAFEARSSSVL